MSRVFLPCLLSYFLIFGGCVQAQLPQKLGDSTDSASAGLQPRLLFQSLSQFEKHLEQLKYLHLHLYLRSEYAYQFNPPKADAALHSVRLDIRGRVNTKLRYRIRTRPFPLFSKDDIAGYNITHFTLDFANISLDITPRISLTAGKGVYLNAGYEFDMIPLFVHMFNDYINSFENVFTLGTSLRIKYNDKHYFTIGATQVHNKTAENLQRASGFRFPVGDQKGHFPLQFGGFWEGSFFNGKLETISGAYTRQYLQNRRDFISIIGIKVGNKKIWAWLDLTAGYSAVELNVFASNIIRQINDSKYFAKGILGNVASFRGTYYIIDKGRFVLTAQYDRLTQIHNNVDVGKLLRQAYRHHLAFEYYPFNAQELCFLLSVQQNWVFFPATVLQHGLHNSTENYLAIGFLYRLPIL